MSAYALPGLFPPIENSSPKQVPEPSLESSSTCSEPPSPAANSPLHEQKDNSLGSSLLMEIPVPNLNTSDHNFLTSDDIAERPGIVVKEAKIDPVRLIQSVSGTSKAQQPQQRKTLRRRSSRERLDSPQTSPTRRQSTLHSGGEEERFSGKTPHDEAIEFELSISFNGRKYNATRTLQCIMQLRDDLIREMNSRKQWLQMRRASQSVTFEVTRDSSDTPEDIEIPEIPPISGEESGPGAGFVGRGFTMLHAMVTSYGSSMERWLRNVMMIVPQDSQCLSNFLWEPLANETPLELCRLSCNSLAALGSIKELEYNTEDDESDDDEF